MAIKDKFFRYVFQKATSFKCNPREIVAIANAKTIGILFDATHPHQVDVIKKFVDSLHQQGKTVTLFGFYNKKKITPESNVTVNDGIITRADLHWYGLPNKSTYAYISNQHFDILINTCTWHCIPLLVISAASKAKFRIGKYFEDATNCFDFMLNLDANTSLEEFLTQIKDFSTKLRN